ncbi:exonuclease domain-containing protein [Corynebacterium breve]|uniref:Exonuclease domain-containing protein n=1 Tax=Corynebacterium breve TaxID=3049799 RepID=A0ABY8VI92_9CORY|nr:exonuclease domain-containing protein [Corynebacterium breve]WIM68691.1 exonuclease domain-containing protein [Corynebacterium breve]
MFGLFGGARREVSEGQLLAIDVETTGLSPKKDQLVSVGYVPVNGREIDLSGAGYFVLAGATVGNSATVHGVTDDIVAKEGVEPALVLDAVVEALEGRKLLAHFAQIETGFLDHLHKTVRGSGWKFREHEIADTMTMERRHMERMGTYPRGEDLRLARVRRRYGLPNYGNHNALTDAIACAEVYLALTAE